MINCILDRKAIIFTKENNQKVLQQTITIKSYIYIFINPKITLLKKFKANILDNQCFSNWLLLLTIDEIHHIKVWDKSFCPLYAKIAKVQKKF